jgi:hypothetical protein
MKSATVTVVLLALQSSVGCKDAASTVVEKSVAAAKETTKGIEDGVEKGRKNGESLDGAVVVSTAAELAGKGSIAVYAVKNSQLGPESSVTLAVENTLDKPLRITKLQVFALDKEGFIHKPTSLMTDVTIAPRAKDKVVFQVGEKAEKLAKIRLWDKDIEIDANARKQ